MQQNLSVLLHSVRFLSQNWQEKIAVQSLVQVLNLWWPINQVMAYKMAILLQWDQD